MKGVQRKYYEVIARDGYQHQWKRLKGPPENVMEQRPLVLSYYFRKIKLNHLLLNPGADPMIEQDDKWGPLACVVGSWIFWTTSVQS